MNAPKPEMLKIARLVGNCAQSGNPNTHVLGRGKAKQRMERKRRRQRQRKERKGGWQGKGKQGRERNKAGQGHCKDREGKRQGNAVDVDGGVEEKRRREDEETRSRGVGFMGVTARV